MILKLLSTCHFNKKAFKKTMRKIWRLTKPVKFYEPGVGLFLAKFENENDNIHALKDGTWYFDKSLVLTRV